MTPDPPDPRYVDVVMEGGVTSGVIYPGFVDALHEGGLELRCIGGTSAGAIAATGAAAAQLGQLALGEDDAPPPGPRPGGQPENLRLRQGFAGLDDLAQQIVQPAPKAPEGELRLRQLFEPVGSTRHLFRLADAVRPPKHLAGKTKAGRVYTGMSAAIAEGVRSFAAPAAGRVAWLLLAFGLLLWIVAIGLVVGGGLGVLLGVLIALFAAAVSAAALSWALARRSLQAIADNQYGVVSGMPDAAAAGMRSLGDADADADYRLSEYFVRVFDELAGIEDGARDGHLTFGDLWGVFDGPLDVAAMDALRQARGQPARGAAPRALHDAVSAEELRLGTDLVGAWPPDRLVNLELISTCMTLGRPFTFPLDPDADVPDGGRWDLERGFFWRSEELSSLFPPSIIEQMEKASPVVERWASRQHGTIELRSLPPVWRLPVIVPMRMSLSVPVFFSAVPLWKRQDAERDHGDHQFVHCWFADGGITSNLPIHFFDSPSPPWPTFAINLSEPDPDLGWEANGAETRCALSREVRLWRVFGATNIDKMGASPFTRLRALLLGGVVTTARKWSDTVQAARAPYNERVIHVGLTPDEGGFNLNMTKETIDTLRDYGRAAGARLVTEFRGEAWPKHRRARIRSMLAAMAAAGSEIEAGRRTPAVDATLGDDLLTEAERTPAAAAGLRAIAARLADEPADPPTPDAPRLPVPNPAQRQRVRF